MRVAALDLGTNSFLCLIAEVEDGRIIKVLSDQVEVVRLGQGVNQTRLFHPDALVRAEACLHRFSMTIKGYQPEAVLAMATSAARDVSNSEQLFCIGAKLGIPIEIIPGGKEAEITFLGATSALPRDGKTRLVIDVGGGSTEYIIGRDHQVLYGQSLNIGCVRLTEKFASVQPILNEQHLQLRDYIDKQIKKIAPEISKYKVDQVLAVAGTPSAIAAAELGGFVEEKVDGHILTVARLSQWEKNFAELSAQQIAVNYKIEAGRADVIFVGSVLLQRSLLQFGIDRMTVSTKGVRYGVALEIAKRRHSHGELG